MTQVPLDSFREVRSEDSEAVPSAPPRPLPRRTWLDRLAWRLLEKQTVPAFFASSDLMPPEGACGWTDLVGRPGAMTSYLELSGRALVAVYEACCPGCGQLVARLDPDQYPIYGEEGSRHNTAVTCAVPIWFSGCCGWYGRLEHGMWRGRSGTLIAQERQEVAKR